MDDTVKIYEDKKLQNELKEIYAQYHNSIKVFIGQLESLQNKFPVEILNEIRAVFSHIAKIYVCENEEVAWENVNKAKGHIKRAQLDSFKFMCYAFDIYYRDFRELYKNVDLSYVNNGDFIHELSKTYASAVAKAQEAQLVESNGDDVIDSYKIYEDAYYEYALTYKLIFDNLPVMEKLQQKEKLQKEELDKEKRKTAILTYLSIGLGILSVVLGFVAFI